MTTLTHDIATFTSALTLETLPPQVVEKARTCVLNAFGMGLNGLDTPYVKVAREAVLATEGEVANGATDDACRLRLRSRDGVADAAADRR
jgi:2-methylcitrate dehydratase PrpD